MHRGLYEAASAMLVQETNLDVVTNNLANVDTPGYKRRVSANADFSALIDRIEKVSEDSATKITTMFPADMPFKGRQAIGTMALAQIFSEDVMDTAPGVVKTSENPLDMTIDGKGFFAVADTNGNTFYTRAGNFTLNNAGSIVNPDGMTLQGEGGEITVPANASRIQVMRDGRVVADNAVVGRVNVFDFDNPTYLKHEARNLLTPTQRSGEALPVENVKIWGGTLEMSNVEVVTEMVRMIEAQRAYEGASKALMTHDEQTQRLITSYSRG